MLRFRDELNEFAESDEASGVVAIHLAGHDSGLKDALNYKANQPLIVATFGDGPARVYLQSILNRPPEFTANELADTDHRIASSLATVKLNAKRTLRSLVRFFREQVTKSNDHHDH